MSKNLTVLDNYVMQVTEFIIRYKYLVTIVLVGLAVAISTGAKRLTFTPDYSVFFSGENPELNTFKDFQNTYTKNDNFFFVLRPKDNNVFTVETLQAIEDLTEKAWKIPYANRVDSLTNFQHTYADGDDLIVEDLVYGAETFNQAQIEQKRKIALSEPLLRDQLITSKADAAGVNVVLQLPKKTVYEVPTAAAKARELKSYIEKNYPNIEVYLTGFGMLNNAFGESGYMDSKKLVPIMYLVLIIAAIVVLRSIVGTIVTLIVAYLSMGVGLGIGGYSGIFLTPISNSAPVVIITLAIADTIHIFLSVKKSMQNGMQKNDAIIYAMRQNFVPVTITSLTTAIGFLSLNFSDAPPYWHLGNMSAAGISAGWVLSVTLVPALLAILPFKINVSEKTQFSDRISEQFGAFIAKNASLVFMLGLLFSLGLALLIPTIQFNDQWSDYFDESIQFRRDTDTATQYFGLYPIEYSVPAKGPQGVSDVQYLQKLAEFTEFLRTQEDVVHVFSITDILKRLNKNMNGDSESYYRLPDNSSNVADYLLVYELSLPYGLDLNDRINVDKSASRVTVMLGKTSTAETKRFIDSTQKWIQENLPDYMDDTKPTSAHVMFTYITDRNVSSMISGTIVAIILISVVLTLTLRNLKLGLLSLIPNALPILSAFGVWAVLVGTVGFSVAAVAAISLGIVVDDTVHFLSKYQLARIEKGLNAEDSIIYSFKTVGPAIISSTLILISGFLVMASSTFKINLDLGVLTAITIFIALFYDLLFLPALLILFDKERVVDTFKETGNAEKSFKSSATGTTALTVLGILVTSSIFLYSPENHASEEDKFKKGYDISAQSDRSDLGFTSSRAEVTMILRNANGGEAKRVLDIKTLEVPDDDLGDKTIVVFRVPADISGTAFLSHAKIIEPDDQWLFLKSMNRIKRISSKNKSGPFMGSEFAFEDFTALELNKYSHEWVKDDIYKGLNCDVIKRVPKYEFSGYSSMLVWIDKDIHQVRKIEYFDRKEDLLKTLTLDDYKQDGGYWRAHAWRMENHQTKKVTDLNFSGFQFKVGLREEDFVKDRLKNIN